MNLNEEVMGAVDGYLEAARILGGKHALKKESSIMEIFKNLIVLQLHQGHIEDDFNEEEDEGTITIKDNQ